MSEPVFNQVRDKNDSSKILSFGFCDFTGQFDSNIFEQVSEPLPNEYTMINTISIKDKIKMSQGDVMEGLFTFLTKSVAKGFVRAYPDFIVAMQVGEVSSLKEILDEALEATYLNEEQYNGIINIFSNHGISLLV